MIDELLYGLCNPFLDVELDTYVREQNPNYDDDKVLKEVNKMKKKLTFFNEQNSKKNSVKKIKKDK